MSRSRPIVVRPVADPAAPATPDAERRHLYDTDGRWVGWAGWIRNDDSDLDAFILRVGGEPEHVNVDGPEAPDS